MSAEYENIEFYTYLRFPRTPTPLRMKRSSDLSYITAITDGNMMLKDKGIMCSQIDVALQAKYYLTETVD